MDFRTLRADEIECRVATVKESGCSLLLYKDARADMILLDETVGAENWQRSHEVINGNLFCNVSIFIDGKWVSKQDVGTESNTEAEKGQASDAFKRACVNWGIGRELYTAPFIWVNVTPTKGNNGKLAVYDKFRVTHIAYDDKRNIKELTILNEKTGKEVFSFPAKRIEKATPKQIEKLREFYDEEALIKHEKVNKLEDITLTRASELIDKAMKEKKE